MKKKRFSVEQITSVLQQVAAGVPVGDVCRHWASPSKPSTDGRKSTAGCSRGEARGLKQLRDENTKLKRIVADLSLDKVMLQDVVQKSSKAGQAARGHAVLDGPLHSQRATGVSGHSDDAILGVLPKSGRIR